MKALILAGGLGTRLRPLTNSIPKCMVNIAGKPCVERVIDYLNNFGIKDIMINLHYLYPSILEYFGNRLIYLYEPDLLGTAGTIKKALPWMDEELLVLNGDTLNTLKLNEFIDAFHKIKIHQCLTSWSPLTGHNTGIMMFDKKSTHDWWPDTGMIDKTVGERWERFATMEYFDIGTPEKLQIARDYYEGRSRILS